MLTAAAVVVGALVVAAPASALAHRGTLFRNVRSQLCLTSAGVGEVRMGSCNGANDWYISVTAHHKWIVDRHYSDPRRCLKETRNRGVTLARCRTIFSEEWTVTTDQYSEDWYSNFGSGQCLVGGNTGSVYVRACRNSYRRAPILKDTKQLWSLIPVEQS